MIFRRVFGRAGYGETVDIECGQDGCNASRPECQPITVPTADPAFTGKKCLEFVRSQAVPNLNCTMGKSCACLGRVASWIKRFQLSNCG